MAQQDISPKLEKIMSFIENNGPSLPTHIASELGESMLFSSAYLAQLLSDKKLVISHMKVGSSPIYFIVGQEPLLEKYSVHVKGKPGEAYALLKEKKFLKDSEQLPAIRVALRSIKDFAKPFRFKEEIYWRYLTNGVEEFLSEKNEEVVENKSEVVDKPEEVDQEQEEEKEEEKDKVLDIYDEYEGVLFVDKVREYLEKEKIIILEETEVKKREFFGRGRIQSDIGELEVLIVGRDKKNITEKDIEKAMEDVVGKKMLVLFLSTGEVVKKAKDIYREHKNLIRFVRI